MNSLQIDHASWNFTEQGSGNALLLIHGFPLDRRIWQQMTGLLTGFRVICVDLPGFGQSTIGKGFTIESLADGVAELVRQCNLAPFVLGGLSMGGYIALAYASKYASTLAGLALIDTKSDDDTPQQKQGRAKMIDLCRTGGSKAVADELLGKMLSEQTIRQSPQTVRELRGIMEACPPRTIETALTAIRDRNDHTSLLSTLPVPLQVIVGQDDVIAPPPLAEAMANAKSDTDLTIIPGAGHMSPMEQPAAVAAALTRFLQACFRRP